MDFGKKIIELISYPTEREWFEFKENWYEAKGIGEYISSLSNAAALFGEKYGYLVWGVNDKTHEIVGTNFDYTVDVKNEPLQHYLARQLFPDNNFCFEEVKVDEKRLVIMQVPAAQKVPTSFDGIRYLRIGSSKVNLAKYPDREANLFQILNVGLPTVNNIVSEYQDLTFDKLFVYYASKGVILNSTNFKKNLGLLTDDGKYNLLAQLLSDDSHIPIRFSVFSGTSKASTMYSVREFGNTCLLLSLDKVLEYGEILNVPQADERNRKVERKEVPLFNAEAFREAIINAFVHNSWVSGNAPMITVFSDRIEILSRGTLPPGQTTEGFFAGESVPVNQKLSDIFLQLHISERTGRGVPKITGIYGKETYEFRDNSIVVAIPFNKLATDTNGSVDAPVDVPVDVPVNVPVATQDSTQKEKILSFCREPKSISEILKMLGYTDKRTVRKYLNPLIEQGRVAMTVPDKPNSKNQKYVTLK